MIKYYVNMGDQSITAVLSGTKFDAQYSIAKQFRKMGVVFQFTPDYKYMKRGADTFGHQYDLSDTYHATVRLRDGDTYSVEAGKEQAKKKVMKNYYKALDRRVLKFKENLMQHFNIPVPLMGIDLAYDLDDITGDGADKESVDERI